MSLSDDNATSTRVELAGPTQFAIIAFIYLFMAVVGILGNSLVIASVALCRKLQTATNVFVVSLAVTDLLSCLTLPFQAGMFLSVEGSRLPDALCAFIGAISIICFVGSILTLALIAFNRCFLITQPKKNYSWLYNTRNLCIMTAIAWLYPTIVLVIPQTVGVGRLGYSPSYKACLWDDSHPRAYINDILVAITFFFTFLIILVCYVKIWIYIHRHVRRLRFHSSTKSNTREPSNLDDLSSTQEHHTDTQVSSPSSTPHSNSNGVAEKMRRPKTVSSREIEITKNLFYVICAFFICIIPYTITLTLPIDPILDLLVLYASIPLMFNGCVNPIIYAYKHPTMKVVFRYIIKCQISSIPKPSKCLRLVLSVRSSSAGVRSEGPGDLRLGQTSKCTPPNVSGMKESPQIKRVLSTG